MATMGNRGLYATACESSPNKTQIDAWMNEGKSNSFISRELEKLGEKISDKSIAKYRSYRDQFIQKELQKDPLYQAQMQTANQALVDEVSKMKPVNVLNHLAETIEHCAELVGQAKMDEIKVRNIQDLRYVQMSMMEALKLYGETILKAQAFAKIEEDPTLLKPTISVQVKDVLKDVLGGVDGATRLSIVDALRASLGQSQPGGHAGDSGGDRSGGVDRAESYIEGEAVLIQGS